LTREQFKELFDNHFDAVRNYIYYRSGDGDMATDIAQEVFIKIWEKQPAQYDNIAGLLFKIARDMFISHYRKEKIIVRFRLNAKAEHDGRSPEDQIMFEEMKDKYEQVLASMPEKQRTVFLMSRMEQLKYHEMAERLGLSVKAVEKRMNLALATLKKAFGDY
jgi:RNA polymerase sigma-70 factor (ECF subfamily)